MLAADRARIHPPKKGVPIDSRAGEFDDVNILYEPVNSSAKVVPDLFVSFGTGKMVTAPQGRPHHLKLTRSASKGRPKLTRSASKGRTPQKSRCWCNAMMYKCLN